MIRDRTTRGYQHARIPEATRRLDRDEAANEVNLEASNSLQHRSIQPGQR